jgi:CheY-like chemotaxis protein
MPRGGTVSVRTSLVELDGEFVRHRGYGSPGRYALLSFSDNGVGMDEETRQRIFEPFFTTKGVGKGTGLGLSTSYGIVKQHQGYIICRSEPARGTTFRVYLPVVGDDAKKPQPSPRPAPTGGAEMILLAEDDPLVRGLTGDVLRQFGYTVIEAVDGEEAVARFREQQEEIRLVILDLVMPRKNGREAYEEVSRLRPGIRAIFTSGYPAEVFRKDELHQKGYDFISKTAPPHELLRKVREALDA